MFEYDFLFVHFMDNLLLITKFNWGVLNVFLNIKELYVIVKRLFFFKFNLIIQLLYNLIIFSNLIIINEILQSGWQLTANIKFISANLRFWRWCKLKLIINFLFENLIWILKGIANWCFFENSTFQLGDDLSNIGLTLISFNIVFFPRCHVFILLIQY